MCSHGLVHPVAALLKYRHSANTLTAAANCCMPGMRSLTGLADSSACMNASCADERSSWGPAGRVHKERETGIRCGAR